MLPFLVNVTLTGLVRISKVRYCWKYLSLKLLLFINLYPASRRPSIFLDKSGRLKRSVAWRDKTGTILEPWTNRVSKHKKPSLEFWETSIFYTHHSKRFQETIIYFLRNILKTNTIRTYIECTDQWNLCLQFERS